MSTIVRYSAHSARKVLVTFICNEEIPPISVRTRELSTAIDEFTAAANGTKERLMHLETFKTSRIDFEMAHPEIYSEETEQIPRWRRLLRRNMDDVV